MFEYNDIDYLKEKLKIDIDKGLSNDEARRRQFNGNKNVLEGKKKENIFSIIFRQLKDPMIYILLVSIAISLFLKEYSDALVIAIVVSLNAIIGAIQEIKTEKALEALKKMSSNKCYVIRENNKILIDTSELVKGDVVCLENGNSVPADLRIVENYNLSIDESSITGESHPVSKSIEKINSNITNLGDKKNLAYMSTLVVNGHGKGVVVSVGMDTEIGKIARMLKEEEKEITPLQKRLFDLGKLLGVVTVCVCFLMFIISVLEKRDVMDMLISSISLAVAAIPEGLPAVVTIVLAIGVQRMIKVNAIVKRLPSVETLGAVSVVCSDKTGTLTENKLQCKGIYQNGMYKENNKLSEEILIRNISCCNNADVKENKYTGNPMEIALLKLLDENNIKIINYKRIKEKEFDSSRKMMSTLNIVQNKKIQFTKGAYDRIIRQCKYLRINGENKLLTNEMINQINHQIDKCAMKAYRILAFSYKENCEEINENEMIFLGFITFLDPPKKGVKEAIDKFKKAGVRTIMITGDYVKTAEAIGKELEIIKGENESISGEELDKIDDEELLKIVEKKSIYARVTPLHKARIVGALKRNNHIVAMSGDGVNDAPSLKKADIGISMGITGSDVAKEASDMILLDDNFTTIEVAIEEGRTIYNNIKKSVLFLLSSNFAEIIVMLVSIVLGLPLPLLAIHILVVNLLTDSIPALALGADTKDLNIMDEKPRKLNETLFANGGLLKTIIYGLLIAGLTMFAFLLPTIQSLLSNNITLDLKSIRFTLENKDLLLRSQTYAFVVLSLSELFYAMAARNLNSSILTKGIFKNKYLNLSIIGGVLVTSFMILLPITRNLLKLTNVNIYTISSLIVISASVLLFHEIIALLFHMKHNFNKDKKNK